MNSTIRDSSLATLRVLLFGAFAWAQDGDGAEQLQEQVAQVRERLALTEEQIDAIEPILQRSFEEQAAVLEDAGFNADGRSRGGQRPNLRRMRALNRDLDAIRKATREELAGVLSEQQLEDYAEIQQDRRAQLRGRIDARR